MSSITQNKYKFTSRTIEYFIWGKHRSLPTGSLDLLTASDCPFWMYYNHTLSCLLGTQALWALNSHSTSLDSSGSRWAQRAPQSAQQYRRPGAQGQPRARPSPAGRLCTDGGVRWLPAGQAHWKGQFGVISLPLLTCGTPWPRGVWSLGSF